MVSVAVVGAAGYTGVEAMRWILAHPRFDLVMATSGADAGTRVAEVYPAFAGSTDIAFTAPDAESLAEVADAAVLAVPHTAAMALAPLLLDAGLKVVDLSADFRLTDPAVYEQWYETPHVCPDLLAEAVYGLPEVDRSKLAAARLVAGPGCYPTATTLAAMPALEAGVAKPGRVIVDAKSGVSGAGRTPTSTTHYCSANEAVAAYKVGAHRHIPEIEQVLTGVAGEPVSVMFAPHLVPMARGLLSTVYMEATDPSIALADVHALYVQRYAHEPFVHVHDLGRMPSTAEVRGTNRAAIGVTLDEHTGTVVASCAIDNLGKGAAGQGIQCLNAMFGLPETEGLDAVGAVV